MKTIIKNGSLLLCLLATLVSCERKPIYDDCICNNTLSIPINIDWATSGITLQNVTILFYDSEDGTLQYEHYYEHNSKDIQSYVLLPEGSYTAVVFNELREDQPANKLSCEDHENISTLRFDILDASPLRSRATTRSYTEQPNDLAVAVVEGLEVTEAMILEAAYATDDTEGTKSLSATTKATVESLTDVVPVKKNTTINISAHFDNIYYARVTSSPGALVDLVNLSDGYYVYEDQNSSSTTTLQFVMSELEYDDGSLYNGTVSGSVSTFGTLGDRASTSGHDDSTPITLDILFMLKDTDLTEVGYNMDVTDQVTHETLSDGSIVMTMDVDFDESLPVVEPDGSDGDSAFGTKVEDWNVVHVPLTQ